MLDHVQVLELLPPILLVVEAVALPAPVDQAAAADIALLHS